MYLVENESICAVMGQLRRVLEHPRNLPGCATQYLTWYHLLHTHGHTKGIGSENTLNIHILFCRNK